MIFKKHDKFANEKWKGVISVKIKAKNCFADKDLFSWTGLGRAGHVQITTVGLIWHGFGFSIRFLTKLIDDSVWCLPEKLKNHITLTANPNI